LLLPNKILMARAGAVGVEKASRKIAGLDSIRFLCATAVVQYHMGLFELRAGSLRSVANFTAAILDNLFNGPAAVIVFFVISGFCIHYPFRGGRPLVASSFYARRFIRIVPPALVFSLVLWGGLHDKSLLQQTVLWSIVCETIYYLIYPLLLYVQRRSSWLAIVACGYCCAIVWISTHLADLRFGAFHAVSTQPYVVFGWATWIVGLPCWLLGCWLAEAFTVFSSLPRWRLWLIRFAIYGVSILLGIVRFRFQSPWASDCVLLDLYAVPIFFWIGYEIAHYVKRAPWRVLEWGGSWSYSLYLVHPLAIPLLSAIGLTFVTKSLAMRIITSIIVFPASYGFYWVVERPSHRLAVVVARFFDKRVVSRT